MTKLTENNPQGTANIVDDRVLATVFDFNERVVWDSGFGYEIGHFLGEGNHYDTWLIDVRTGLITEPCSHSKSEVFKYTNELINKLTAKYGYEPKGKSHFYLPGSPERFTSQEIIDIWSNRANDDLYERWKKAIIHNKENIQKQNNRE